MPVPNHIIQGGNVWGWLRPKLSYALDKGVKYSPQMISRAREYATPYLPDNKMVNYGMDYLQEQAPSFIRRGREGIRRRWGIGVKKRVTRRKRRGGVVDLSKRGHGIRIKGVRKRKKTVKRRGGRVRKSNIENKLRKLLL